MLKKHQINLPASKSISNRLLIINALSGNNSTIINLSKANDTAILNKILTAHLSQPATQIQEINCEDAGTAMRFLTAYFSLQKGQWLLRGNDRMHQRPIGVLVDKLQELGADIKYLGNSGYPPLLINGKTLQGGKIEINASISSQYISALIMIAPYLQNGLQLRLTNPITSKPYIDMTLGLLQQLEIKTTYENNVLSISEGRCKHHPFSIESDWSAAAYWYAFMALSSGLEIELKGLQQNSLQGDSVVVKWMRDFGVATTFIENGVVITATDTQLKTFEQNFRDCPDLAPTFICLCAAKGISAKFYGLESLAIKESDRTQALSIELEKVGVSFSQKNDYWELIPNTNLRDINSSIEFETYGDHRLAMALAMYKLILPSVTINTPEVVKKSYLTFWDDFEGLTTKQK